MAWQSGRKAMGAPHEQFFAIGQPFDAVVLKATSPLAATASLQNLCNTFVYTADVSDIAGTIVRGKWICRNSESEKRDEVVENFVRVIRELGTRG